MMKNTKLYSIGALLLLVLLFGVLSLLSSNLLTGARLDLTENRLFTLSEGTGNILESLTEPVTLYYFFSEDSSRDLPQIRTYARRVQELLHIASAHIADADAADGNLVTGRHASGPGDGL